MIVNPFVSTLIHLCPLIFLLSLETHNLSFCLQKDNKIKMSFFTIYRYLHFKFHSSVPKMVNDAKILIIGAGAAGIAAASHLFKNGFQNLLILEAENRLGGRINTVPFCKYKTLA